VEAVTTAGRAALAVLILMAAAALGMIAMLALG
jgi:hypothetical protein